MKKYLLCAVAIMLLASCNQDDLQRLRTENQELKNRLAVLEQENAKLKETAEFHYQKGVDLIKTQQYEAAKKEFEVVLERFPRHAIVTEAKAQLTNMTNMIEKINSEKELQGKSKIEICKIEAEKEFVGKTSFMNDWQGRLIESVRESITLKCDYGDLFTSGRIFNKYNGSREPLNWSQNPEDVVCPETVKKYGSICK